jgi:hypothetical protein
MLALFVAGLVAMPWDKPAPPPKDARLVLEQPAFPDPPPEGSVIDLPAERLLPIGWRTTEKAPTKGKANAGLADLQASGSGQFCRDQFYALREVLRGHRVILVDLRQEPHTFLDGGEFAWGPPAVVGDTRSAGQVERIEQAWTQRLEAAKFATATAWNYGIFANAQKWEPIELKLDIREAGAESRLAGEAGWSYFRIAAPDAITPRDADLDRFIAFVRDLSRPDAAGVWLHFHCDTGGNRTTLYMTLYDMMRNYTSASRPDIIARQHRLGGIDLLAGANKAERAAFLERFYSYCWQCGPLFRRSWTSWSRANP